MLDSISRQILEELQHNGRVSYRDLGERVALSAPAVTERVKRLERDGIITATRPSSIRRHSDTPSTP